MPADGQPILPATLTTETTQLIYPNGSKRIVANPLYAFVFPEAAKVSLGDHLRRRFLMQIGRLRSRRGENDFTLALEITRGCDEQ